MAYEDSRIFRTLAHLRDRRCNDLLIRVLFFFGLWPAEGDEERNWLYYFRYFYPRMTLIRSSYGLLFQMLNIYFTWGNATAMSEYAMAFVVQLGTLIHTSTLFFNMKEIQEMFKQLESIHQPDAVPKERLGFFYKLETITNQVSNKAFKFFLAMFVLVQAGIFIEGLIQRKIPFRRWMPYDYHYTPMFEITLATISFLSVFDLFDIIICFVTFAAPAVLTIGHLRILSYKFENIHSLVYNQMRDRASPKGFTGRRRKSNVFGEHLIDSGRGGEEDWFEHDTSDSSLELDHKCKNQDVSRWIYTEQPGEDSRISSNLMAREGLVDSLQFSKWVTVGKPTDDSHISFTCVTNFQTKQDAHTYTYSTSVTREKSRGDLQKLSDWGTSRNPREDSLSSKRVISREPREGSHIISRRMTSVKSRKDLHASSKREKHKTLQEDFQESSTLLTGEKLTTGSNISSLWDTSQMISSSSFKKEMNEYLTHCAKIHQKLLYITKILDISFNKMCGLYVVFGVFGGLSSIYLTNLAEWDTKMASAFFLLLGEYVLLLFMCLVGNQVSEEAEKVRQAVYACNWFGESESFKLSLRIILTRMNRSLLIKAGGLPLSVGTFRLICRAGYYSHMVLSKLLHGETLMKSP